MKSALPPFRLSLPLSLSPRVLASPAPVLCAVRCLWACVAGLWLCAFFFLFIFLFYRSIIISDDIIFIII
nr:MAG TPA: hypothetical protein [Caudoviricetes sp.]